ncbi:protein pet117, mitochondrial [Diachasma alloeum]|uniref:protein pet117, mitochondrial n=1 Tax=Diachasma alloeum TaxID=454923 RepID=UPI0007381E22|nr:protein pet117, mitochondrial [Diachasma alloeum]
MSWKSRLFLLGASGFSGGIVYYVHCMQSIEREQLRTGVMREVERRATNASRKTENVNLLNQQRELENYLRKEQEVERGGQG